jgi:hypothetical protein
MWLVFFMNLIFNYVQIHTASFINQIKLAFWFIFIQENGKLALNK